MFRRVRRLPAVYAWLPALLAAVALAAAGWPAPRHAGAQEPPRTRTIVVQPGDTLSGIALRVYGSVAAVDRIAAANGLADPNRVLAGASLLLPTDDGGPAGGTTASSGAANAADGRQVTVEPGDTLSSIAGRYYGSPGYAAALAAVNGLADPNRVVAGMKLTIPATLPAAAVSPAAGPLTGKRICLDPGHGGAEEPGAVFDFGSGQVLREADVTLDMARNLRAWLEADGATVTVTRSTDTYLGLDERAAICNAAGSDITVSLHLNGANPAIDGTLTLFYKPLDRPLAEPLALALQKGLTPTAPSRPFTAYGAREFDGRVLLQTVMPAVIVEPVFLTNPGEARALLAPTAQQDSRRHQIAVEIYRGIRMYFAR